jgi:Cys-tRNA(Pro)/Cys-tRNA(Cys) deacylase
MKLSAIESMLKKQCVDFEIIAHQKPIKSRKDALDLFKIEETAPTLILDSGVKMYALIINGSRKTIDFEAISKKLDCGKIALASSEKLLNELGMNPGEVAMVGHGLPCILDNKLFKNPYVYGGIGDAFKTLKINPADLKKVNDVILYID